MRPILTTDAAVGSGMHTCHNCNGAVSNDFVRVFGDDSGRVHGCPDCTTRSELVS